MPDRIPKYVALARRMADRRGSDDAAAQHLVREGGEVAKAVDRHLDALPQSTETARTLTGEQTCG